MDKNAGASGLFSNITVKKSMSNFGESPTNEGDRIDIQGMAATLEDNKTEDYPVDGSREIKNLQRDKQRRTKTNKPQKSN